MRPFFILLFLALPCSLPAQVTTSGFLNLPRPEAPGTLLSGPLSNDSSNTGRTTTLNYINGWLIVGAEAPGSAPGSDLEKRVYDIADPANPIRRFPSDFNLVYPNDSWYAGNDGWNAHGTAQSGPDVLPNVMRVETFGGIVQTAFGTYDNGIPELGEIPVGWNRSSQAGPWQATNLWYGTPNQMMEILQVHNDPGYTLTSIHIFS